MDVGLYLFWMLWATLAYTDDDGELGYRMPISDVLSEENGVETACPWPFDPILPHMMSAPLGQYHCPYCGSMVLAGVPHGDYKGFEEILREMYADDTGD